MKLRSLFLAAMTLMGFIACSNNDEPEYGENQTVNTYLRIQLTDGEGMTSRTLPKEGEVEIGTEAETKISNLLVLIYDEAGVLKKTFVTDNMKNTVDGAQTAIFPMGVGKYQVYVVANASEMEADWANQSGFDVKQAQITGLSKKKMINNYAADFHFIMFNESNGTDRLAGVPIEIAVANTYNNPATCVIALDRLAVKIESQLGALNIDEVKGELGSEFTNVGVQLKGFKLLNGATQVNLQQKWTHVMASVYPYDNMLVTPWLMSADSIFDYYAKYADFRTITYNNEGGYEYVRDNYSLMDFYSGDPFEPIYCMENNPSWNGTSMMDAMRGNTTGLVYQFLLSFDGSDGLAGTNCFYAYGGKFFPSLKKIQDTYPNVFDDANSTSLNKAEDLAAAQEELRALYAQDDVYSGIAEFRGKYQVKVYMDGLMYYIYYIKDKNYEQSEKNYYAVMRNTVYDLTVQKLLRVGDDIPGGWNPDTKPYDPVDPTNTYMNVTVKVNPWVMNKEDIELK